MPVLVALSLSARGDDRYRGDNGEAERSVQDRGQLRGICLLIVIYKDMIHSNPEFWSLEILIL